MKASFNAVFNPSYDASQLQRKRRMLRNFLEAINMTTWATKYSHAHTKFLRGSYGGTDVELNTKVFLIQVIFCVQCKVSMALLGVVYTSIYSSNDRLASLGNKYCDIAYMFGLI